MIKLRLKNGIEVKIKQLHQWATYDYHVDELPTCETNNMIIEKIVKKSQSMCNVREYYVIEPEQTPININSSDNFEVFMSLPPIVYVAYLSHHEPIRDEKKIIHHYC